MVGDRGGRAVAVLEDSAVQGAGYMRMGTTEVECASAAFSARHTQGPLMDALSSCTVANHKRRRPKQRRAGCLLCKPHKLTSQKKAERRREYRDALRHELRAASGQTG